jgi:hypothetical protein
MEDTTSAASPTPTQSTTTIGDASAALAMADSSLATPETTTPAPVDTPAAATAQPGAETAPPDEPSIEGKGEPPKWRWQDILANARETAAKEADAKARQEYEWAKDIAAQERDGLLVWRAAMNGDPQAIARIKSNPQAAQWMRGLIAEQQQPQEADPMPEPDLQAGDGSLVYSAKQGALKDEWLERRLEAKLSKKFEEQLQPLQAVAQTSKQKEAEANYTAATTKIVHALESAHPEFKAHRADVWGVINGDQQLTALALDPATAAIAIKYAWGEVYRDKVLPLQQQHAEAKVLTGLQQRAVAATTNPTAASAATPKPTLGNARAALEHAYSVTGS